MGRPATDLQLQRTTGRGDLSVGARGADTVLRKLGQAGAAKIRIPAPHGDPVLSAVLINTAGGVTGGDELHWSVEVQPDASLAVSTQACERIYRSIDGAAQSAVTLIVAPGARLEWLPQETIFFDRSRFTRRITARLEEGASLLLLEPMVFGRRASGETAPTLSFRDSWRIWRGSDLVHAEALRIDDKGATWLESHTGCGGLYAFASLAYFSDDAESRLPKARRACDDWRSVANKRWAHASHWRVAGVDKLLIRLAAVDSYTLRRGISAVVSTLSKRGALPDVWSI